MDKYIDLTLEIREGMQTFPTHWHPFVEISQLGRFGIENRETRRIVFGTHTGTHVDAPRHFIPNGVTIDEIPLNQINGPATLLDFSAVDSKTEISLQMIKDAAKGLSVERTILRFDWDDYLGTMAYYTDIPWLSTEAAVWLVDNGCRLLGMDTPMPDNPVNDWRSSDDSPIHKILLGSGVVLLEYLTNLAAIGSKVFEVVVAPLKILGADGSPTRAFAIVRGVED
jgi:arylformamidase